MDRSRREKRGREVDGWVGRKKAEGPIVMVVVVVVGQEKREKEDGGKSGWDVQRRGATHTHTQKLW